MPVKRWEGAARLVGLGWYVGICIVLGLLGGFWLDGKFGTKPLLTIVGLVLGLALAVYGVYRMILPGIKGDRK